MSNTYDKESHENGYPCSCCPNKVGRGWNESAFSIGIETTSRCKECEDNKCIPLISVLVDIGVSVGKGWGKYGHRTPLLRQSCTLFQNGKYVGLDGLLNEYDSDIDVIVASTDSRHEVVNDFIDRSGIFYRRA